MDRVLSGNEEQFQMLLMALGDINSGICLFQSEEQSGWVALIQRELTGKKVSVHNIAEDDEKAGMPLISDFKSWASESGADVVIVYNLQLLGLRFGDRKAVEHLNFMRDQLQNIGKLFLFGVSPYFDLLLSRNARDLYSCIRYHFKFRSIAAERSRIERESYQESGGMSGNDALEIERYWEYKKRAQGKAGEEQLRLYLECMASWQRVRGNLPFQETDDIRKMADFVEKYYEKREANISEIRRIWILAGTWLELGEREKGFYWYKLTADRVREELGENHKLYADALVKLSYYYQLISDYEQCEKIYDQALWIYDEKKVPLEDYQQVLIGKAVLFSKKCQYTQALAIYEKLLQYYTKKYGSGYSGNVICLNNIGHIYEELGDASKALDKYQEALTLLLASGKKNELSGALYNNVASVYLESGDLKNAWKNIKLAKREVENLYGRESMYLVRIYNTMSGIWNGRGRIDKEIEYLEKAIGLIKKTHTEETEQAAFIYYNMGSALMQENKPLTAFSFLNHALEVRLKIYGELSVITAEAYEGLGVVCYCLGKDKGYKENMGKAREIYIALYGENDSKVKELEQFMNDNP